MYNKDWAIIARNVFVGTILITIIQKIINPIHYENFSNFIIFLVNIIANKNYSTPFTLFVFILLIEGFIVIGLFQKSIFRLVTILGIMLIGSGILASGLSYYYGLKSSCGCGLFGDIPQLLLAQKLVLLFLLVFLNKSSQFLFSKN